MAFQLLGLFYSRNWCSSHAGSRGAVCYFDAEVTAQPLAGGVLQGMNAVLFGRYIDYSGLIVGVRPIMSTLKWPQESILTILGLIL